MKWLISEPGDAIIILQGPLDRGATELPVTAKKLAKDLVDHGTVSYPEGQVIIGIGTYQDDVFGISTSYRKAREAVRSGCRVAPPSKHGVYEYTALKSYALLQNVPEDILSSYVTETLTPLIRYDRENHSNLMQTLEVYLARYGRSSETAQNLGIHRNTVNFRITRIKELLDLDLDDGEVVFRLQLALHMAHLLGVSAKHVAVSRKGPDDGLVMWVGEMGGSADG